MALNIAMALKRFGMAPVLLSAVGQDAEGDALVLACESMGLDTAHILRAAEWRTDIYMAIEEPNGLVAAIADAHTLEAAGDTILTPLSDGTLGSSDAPYQGVIALDGNLTTELLSTMAHSPLLRSADLRVAPASPGKACRLLPFLAHDSAVLYLNIEEASLLCDTRFETAQEAAAAILAKGAARVLVTNGPRAACDGHAAGLISAAPRPVNATRITGAGDCFMAAHIAAEQAGADRDTALHAALDAAATHVAGAPE
jgi:sugar/nucleoside kinase (ribokinase family)